MHTKVLFQTPTHNSKMRRLLFASLLAFAMPVAAVQAQADAEPQTPPIKAEMKKFDKALDAVIDFLEDGKKGEDLPMAEVAAAQAALQASKQHPPRITGQQPKDCLLYTSPSPRDQRGSRMPSSA